MAIWYLARPEPLLVQGEVESTRVDIAARVSGRLAKIAVARGQNVAAGTTLLVIDNPELLAELREAEAAKLIADAELSRINVGTRAEIVAQRKAEIDRAKADLTLAQQTYDRTKQLAAAQFAPRSKLDQDTNALTLAQKRLDQANSAYQEAVNGFTAEEHEIAEANVTKAAAKIELIKALVDQLTVVAPIASQVYQIPAEEGEVVTPGVPLLSLVDLNDTWLGFSLREDLTAGLKVGDRFAVRVAALGDREIEAEVRVIAPKGEYAGWRATRATGDFDCGPLAIRAYPVRQDRRVAAGDERLYRLVKAIVVKPPAPPSLWLVARREIRFFHRDRAGWFLVVAIPLIAFAVLAWTFGSAVVRGLNVVIVYMDRSAVSTGVIQRIAAAPGLRITQRADSLTTATRAIRSGDAIAAVYIPADFEHDLLAGRRPQIVAFYNTQYFTPGNIASKGLRDAISAASAQLSPLHEVRVQPVGSGPLVIDK